MRGVGERVATLPGLNWGCAAGFGASAFGLGGIGGVAVELKVFDGAEEPGEELLSLSDEMV